MQNYERAAQLAADKADEERTKREFIGFLSSVLGVDQSYTTDDGRVMSWQPGQYVIANPDGTASQLGQPVSNVQRAAAPAASGVTISPGLLLVLGVALLLLR